MSSSAWVGCWSGPEPPFSTGTGRSVWFSTQAVFSAKPASGWREMIRST